ncbi:hypothetical protein DFJ77DRAFT_548102, partial [Powellomyces hirtus]
MSSTPDIAPLDNKFFEISTPERAFVVISSLNWVLSFSALVIIDVVPAIVDVTKHVFKRIT